MKCNEIQDAMFDYMTRELGDGRSDLIGRHLKKCPECQKVAREIKETVTFLSDVSGIDTYMPKHLTDERKARIVWAFTHPFLNWIYSHHMLVSVLATILTIALACALLRGINILRTEKFSGIEVIIGKPPALENQQE